MAFMIRAAHVLQWLYKGKQTCEVKQISKSALSSDCRLQLACMKPESLVIAGQHTAVNVFLSLVHTARQATKGGASEVAELTVRKQAPKMNSVIGTKS